MLAKIPHVKYKTTRFVGGEGCLLCEKLLFKTRYPHRSWFRLFANLPDNNVQDYTGKKQEISINFSKGNSLSLSTGKYAKFSDGCAVGQIGDTSVLVATVSKERTSLPPFFPLIVDYRQKAAAAGRIPTNFLRRELGPTEHEILTSRIIDRSLRPLFPTDFYNDTHVVCNLLAVDGVHDPDIIAINSASAALMLSDIPWNGPVGAVRVGMIGNDLLVNPTRKELAESILNLVVVACNKNMVVMLEGDAKNIMQQDFLKAVKFGVKECQPIIQGILKFKAEVGKPKRVYQKLEPLNKNVVKYVHMVGEPKLTEIFKNHTYDKITRDEAVKKVKEDIIQKAMEGAAKSPDIENYCANTVDKVTKEIFRKLTLEGDIRCDGRKANQLRNISCEVDLYNPLHGSALFQRGQTQVLCTVALDSLESALKLDQITGLTSGIKEKNFFLHYEFPSYATNDLSKLGPSARREVGHGALAERGLRAVIPHNFPFTIRLTSEVLESNGSSSMASVCGGSLALMDAGIPISSAAAGVAVGLITEYNDEDTKHHLKKYKILTDIMGMEDYIGDMDFKLAGTKKGITAIQADIKIPGLPLKIMMEAVLAACDAKSDIIDIMDKVIYKPREPKKPNWPVCERLEIDPQERARFVGLGGVNIKRLVHGTGVQVTSTEDGAFVLFAPNQEAMDEAKEWIEKSLQESHEPVLEFGAIYKAKIVELKDIGVMVTLYEGMTPTLLHNSQLDQRKIHHPSAIGLQVGEEIQVKFFGRDPVSGVMRLSRKVLQGPASNVVRNLM